jgi:protein tyrosine/serine phosphatase
MWSSIAHARNRGSSPHRYGAAQKGHTAGGSKSATAVGELKCEQQSHCHHRDERGHRLQEVASYRDFVSLPSAQAAYRQLFVALAERNNLPALFHCTTGKDRTGWAAAALLSLLGVPKDAIMQDYLRSNDYILAAYRKTIDAFVAGGGEPAIPAAILGVKAEYLNAAFTEMENKYGTIEDYFTKGLGIDVNGQRALRDLLLSRN